MGRWRRGRLGRLVGWTVGIALLGSLVGPLLPASPAPLQAPSAVAAPQLRPVPAPQAEEVVTLPAPGGGGRRFNPAQVVLPAPAIVFLATTDTAAFQAAQTTAREAGADISLAYAPSAFIGILPPAAEAAMRAQASVARIDRAAVNLAAVSSLGAPAENAARTWNIVYAGQPDPAAARAPLIAPQTPNRPDWFIPDPPTASARAVGAAPLAGAPASYETSLYMAGTVTASVVFVESGAASGNCAPADPKSETWDSARRATVLSKIGEGLSFWTSRSNRPSTLTFTVDDLGLGRTSCEPITRPQSDESKWIADALTSLGYPATTATYQSVARDLANARRTALGTDWAYVIFVVDSLNDADGMFSNGYFAYAYLHGPFAVMTYDNDGWGISRMNKVITHETGHIFGALDEYASSGCRTTDTSGYLVVANTSCNNSGVTTDLSVMGESTEQDNGSVDVSSSARAAIGWRNPTALGNGTAVVDVVRTSTAALTAYTPDPTSDSTPTFSATAGNTAFPPGGCTSWGYCYNAVSISKVASAEWQVDGGAWQSAGVAATDGTFNSASEAYTFTPPSAIANGTHTFGTRARNNFGHDSAVATDPLTIAGANPTATATNTPLPTATNTPLPSATRTNTPLPTATNTPLPTATNTPLPTATRTNTPTSVPPTSTATPPPTATNTALPTATNTPLPTATNTPVPTATATRTATSAPTATNTAVPPTATNTALPTATNTAIPTATNTPLPTATNTAVPPTATATATRTATSAPTATNTAVPPTATSTAVPPTSTATAVPATATNTPLPTATNTPLPSATRTSTATSVPPTNTATALPTATATAVPSNTATPLPSSTRTATALPTNTASPLPSATATRTATPLPTSTGTTIPSATATATRTATAVPPTATATSTSLPSATATSLPTNTATPTPTATAVVCATGQWRAEYFNNRTLTGPSVLTRCETSIDNDWGLGSPPGVPVGTDGFSVRWSGRHTFSAGAYTFVATGDDGIRAFLDNTPIIDGWGDHGPTEYRSTQTLTAGDHDLKVEFYENGGGATARFRWESAVTCATGQWRAEYFNNRTLTDAPVLTRCETSIDNDWGLGAPPGVSVGADNFSVRWSGRQTFGAGAYTFVATGDDGIRAFLDNTPIIDGWQDHGPTEYRSTQTLTAGDHDLRVEFYENGGGATAKFRWESAVTCPTGQWRAEYFNNRTLTGPSVLTRCETSIDNDWGLGSPPGVPVGTDGFSVRWSGRQTFGAGAYTFVATGDDGIRAFLDNTPIIDGWQDHGPTEYRSTRTLTAGDHDVTVEFYENGGGATAKFRWDTSCPVGQWRAEYFPNRTLTGIPALTRCEPSITNDWGLGTPPGVAVGTDNFSVRWSGQFPFAAGSYTFIGVTDDGMRVWLDNNLIIDAWFDQGPTQYTATRTLPAGVHDLRVEYYEDAGGATAQFRWQ